MAANPNPSRVSGAMWRLWEGARAALAGVRLGGIYANKAHYHNTVAANLSRWPSSYSVRLAIDRRAPRDKARAIDFTLSSAQMKVVTGRLRDAANRRDPRLEAVREFYGTLDGSTVYGRIKDAPGGNWRASSADSSHTWHVHISIFTPYVDDWSALAGVLAVVAGADGTTPWGGDMFLPAHGDEGEGVRFWQRMLLYVGEKLPRYGTDSQYGDEVAAAVASFWKKRTGNTYHGRSITSSVALELLERQDEIVAERVARRLLDGAGVSDAKIAEAVAAYLEAHPPAPGEDGKTPTRVKLSQYADVVDVE